MYRIYNKAFDMVLSKYGVHSLDELETDALSRVAETLGLNVVPKQDEKTKKFYGVDRDKTMKTVEDYLTFSMYMGDGYWEEKHLKKVRDAEVDAKLGKMKTGDEVFEVMSRHKLGFYKLRPGSSADVDWTERFMEEFFTRTPISKWCDITDLSTGKIYGDKKVETEKEEKHNVVKELETAVAEAEQAVNKNLEELNYNELVALAKSRGIEKPTFKSKPALIELLKK